MRRREAGGPSRAWPFVALLAVACQTHPTSGGVAASASAAPSAAVCPDADPKSCFDRAEKLDMGVGRPEPDKEGAIAVNGVYQDPV